MRLTAHGWWLQDAGTAVPEPPLETDLTCDVVVIGGGYTGMWAAWHLAERGADVVVLESGICGEGPSGRNGGFVDHLAHAAPRLRELAGDDAARATIAESIASIRAIGTWCEQQGVDAWFRPAGQIVASAAPAQDGGEDDAVAACAALGLGGELRPLTGDEVAARITSPVLRGGVLAPSTATIQPGRLARGLRTRLIERGVRVREHSRVRALHERPGEVLVEAGTGRVRAGNAILAAGSRAVALAPLRRRLTVTSSHLVITEPVPAVLEDIGWTGGEAVSDGRHLVHYFRTTPDGRIAFGWGGGRIVCGARLQPRDDADRRLAHRVAADLVRFFPALAGRRIDHAWGGPIDASPAHLPIVDTLPGGRTHFAFGYTGNGVGPSELCGRILARMALDERDALTRLPIVGTSGRLLPPEPLRVAGGEAVRIALDRKERAEERHRVAPRAARAVARLPNLLGVQIGR
ncbi:MAG: NAD(P)/FAD-dependent oxidoreductase [Solirubrobacteraceae bacterium]